MRKTLLFTFLLFILSICVIAGLHFTIEGQKNQVEMTETAIAGRPAAAKGIDVKLNACDNTAGINWDLSYGFADDGAFHTKAVFSEKNKPDGVFRQEQSIHLEPSLGSAGQSSSLPETLPYKTLLSEVLSNLPNGQKKTVNFNAVDYYDTLSVIADGGGNFVSASSYFQIPVPENLELTLSVSKPPAGNVVTYNADIDSLSSLKCDDAGQIIENSGYLAITRVDFYPKEAENSTLPLPEKSRGISHIPLQYESWDHNRLYPVPKIDEARLVYPLSEDTRILSLKTDKKKENLLLLTLENRKIYLTVLKLCKDGALEEVQKLKLLDTASSFVPEPMTGYTLTCSETCLALVLHDTGSFCAAAEEKGKYRVVTSGNLLKNPALPSELTPSVKQLYDSGNFCAAAYDGSRTVLILLQPIPQDILFTGVVQINHYMLVFNGNQLSYMGKIDYNLNDEVFLNTGIPVEISF